jgi:hypothetical protein
MIREGMPPLYHSIQTLVTLIDSELLMLEKIIFRLKKIESGSKDGHFNSMDVVLKEIDQHLAAIRKIC